MGCMYGIGDRHFRHRILHQIFKKKEIIFYGALLQ